MTPDPYFLILAALQDEDSKNEQIHLKNQKELLKFSFVMDILRKLDTTPKAAIPNTSTLTESNPQQPKVGSTPSL